MLESRSRQLFASLAVLVASGILLAGVVVYVLVALLAALAGDGSVLGTALDLAFPTLTAGVVLTVLVAVSGLGVAWSLAHKAADFGSGKFVKAIEDLEPELDGLLADRSWEEWVTPTGERSGADDGSSATDGQPPARSEEAALADLRERYASGEIGDEAFERELERILGGGPPDAGRTGTRGRAGSERVGERSGGD